MKLAYKACDRSGRQVADTIEAPDAASATELLQRKDLFVIDIAEAPATMQKARRQGGGLGRARRLKDVAVFTRQLSVLVSSGTPLVEALAALERQVKDGRWRQAISDIRTAVEEGSSLAEAMDASPQYFDPAYCSLIGVGESSGNLSPMLERLAGLKQSQLRMRNLVIGALIYPILLTVMATAVLIVLLTFVVPRFTDLFETLDAALPASTQALVKFSALLRGYWWAAAIVIVVSITVLSSWLKTPAGKRAKDTLVLRLPQFGNVTKSFAMARITRMLGVLLHGRVPILEALKLTRNATGNVHYNDLIARAEQLVSKGEPIYSAFTDTDLVSPSICETIRNGERSGQIGPLLLHVADFLDEDNEVILRSLTSIIEPVILIVLGLVVGVVAISLFMPLFDLTAAIKGG